jgi:hypothetical protein
MSNNPWASARQCTLPRRDFLDYLYKLHLCRNLP